MWLRRHTVTPNPDCEWHRVGQCRRSPPKWLGVVRQNDSAFRTNTLSRKVLREVLSGILIMKPNKRGSRIRWIQCPGRKRVPGQSWLRLGAIDMTNVNRKERERERQSEKSQHIANIASILKIEYVCMGNAWICDMQKKLHHGLIPIQSYQYTINLHTSKCMIILL